MTLDARRRLHDVLEARVDLLRKVEAVSRRRAEAIAAGWADAGALAADSSRGEAALRAPALSPRRVERLRAKAVREFYLRPSYLLRRLRDTRSLYDLANQAREALGLFG